MSGLQQGQPSTGGGGAAAQLQIAFNSSPWKIPFFVAALCVIAAAILAILDLSMSMEFAPFDFINQVYLVIFGLLMLTLDLPIPCASPRFTQVRMNIHRFLLFMTRFTGRGFWYMFLGTMVFGSLWDLKISKLLGFILGGYIIILGAISFGYGIRLSLRLDGVRQKFKEGKSKGNENIKCPAMGFDRDTFKEKAVALNGTVFADYEMEYIMGGLSWTPGYDGHISKEEVDEWVAAKRMVVL